MSLKVWEYMGHYVIAESEEEATGFLLSALADLGEEPEGKIEWEAMSDKSNFHFTPDGGNTTITKTCAEWCAEHGKGYFCSENW